MRDFLGLLSALSGGAIEKKKWAKKICPKCKAGRMNYWTRLHGREIIAVGCESCDFYVIGLGAGSTPEEFLINAINAQLQSGR